ncbi:MAG: helix-turn-helix domain-containing protein [Chloroflexi bacterium]|nr:helix-turn-helix domain-containing protein [Chloroflexota bacterium]
MQTSEFGSKLKKLREQSGLSQRELAQKIGVDFSYLSKIENGAVPPPSQEVILKLAKVLKADGDELLTLAGKVPADIVRILLKNRNALQSLREGDVKVKSGGVSKSDSFNKRLRELREKAGLSQNELASRVGISFTYLSKIENGVRPPPSEKVILKLAEALGCAKDDLMTLAGRVPSDVAGILKNQELRQSIRKNYKEKKIMMGGGDKMGVNIVKHLVKGRALARIGLAFVLMLAVAGSLWFASPSQVKALTIDITDSNGNSLTSGTLGQTYNFKVTVNIPNPELVPIAGMDVSIISSVNPSLMANLLNLPFTDGSQVNYTSQQTGGGAASVTVTRVNIQQR